MLILVSTQFWGKENYEYGIIYSDGRGYYAFLPAAFIQKDFSFQTTHSEEKRVFNNMVNPHYLIENEKGQTFNKCYPGVAILQLPFFLTAWGIESTYGDDITGYSLLFLKIFHLGAIFFSILGFYFMRKYLHKVLGDERKSIWITSLIFFGTTLFYFTLVRASFSHHYSFFLFALFAYLARLYLESGKRKHIVLIGLTLGLIFLVRPVNVMIVLAIPFILMDRNNIRTFFTPLFKLKNGHLLSSILAFFAMVSIVFVINFLQTGNIMNWSYQGEGFDFSNPHFFQELFSFRTGIFVHIPLAFLCLVGVVIMTWKKRETGIFWIGYIAFATFLLSCWWSWDFGGFYGNRVFLEHLVFFGVPLAYFLDTIKRKSVAIALMSLCVIFVWIRAYQLDREIIPHRMTAQTYFKSLLVVGKDHSNDFRFNRDVQPFGKFSQFWNVPTSDVTPFRFDENHEYGFNSRFDFPEDKDLNRYYFRFEITKTLDADNDYRDVFIVMDAYNFDQSNRVYRAFPMYEWVKEGQGKTIKQFIEQEYFANPRNDIDYMNIYVWNAGKKCFTIEDYQLIVEEYEPFGKE